MVSSKSTWNSSALFLPISGAGRLCKPAFSSVMRARHCCCHAAGFSRIPVAIGLSYWMILANSLTNARSGLVVVILNILKFWKGWKKASRLLLRNMRLMLLWRGYSLSDLRRALAYLGFWKPHEYVHVAL